MLAVQARPENLSSFSRTHVKVEEEIKSTESFSDFHVCAVEREREPHTYIYACIQHTNF